ncbi:hypothetical protein [Cellulophaga baltica]|uniref:Lipoprotein n=1 Tax=Cellulophaga baltica 18 TaxID=1348584 RepID=A0AAU8S696_9FLAO|nr:hypothetical protein [Cellulophaga baltica]AIZ43399.1 hypothetical protein M666_18690 [Cellulophaga baltica 18]
MKKNILLGIISIIFFTTCSQTEKNHKEKPETFHTETKKLDNSKTSSKISQEGNEKKEHKKELDYIKRRNLNVEYFKNKEFNDRTFKENRDSLFALEKLLQHILIPTKVNDINKKGKINLETFLPELGFGMLDGLTTYNKEVSILCTTNFIFSDFFIKQEYKFDNITESNIEDIFSYAFASGYVITSIHSYKINKTENVKAYGMISIDGQDIGPFKPNSLYALVIIEDNIYLISKSIKKELEGIEKCESFWNNVDSESEDKTWENYCECYQREFTNNEQLLPLKNEIEKMVNLIIE